MIAFVRGTVAAVTLNTAVVEVGGVGLQVMCTPNTLATLRRTDMVYNALGRLTTTVGPQRDEYTGGIAVSRLFTQGAVSASGTIVDPVASSSSIGTNSHRDSCAG